MSRITVTIDDETLAELRRQAGPGEVSAYVLEAIRTRLREHPVDRLLRKLDEMYGPLTPDEIEEGKRWWAGIDEKFSSMPEQSYGWRAEIGRSVND